MDSRRIVVVEANEVPLRVVADVARSGRVPFLASLLDDGALVETVVDETLPRELYPSQTWASMNTGVPFEQHGVYWYGDAKPADYPLYWQLAAQRGRTVGLVNTLHSSPVGAQCSGPNYRFAIPDAFGAEDVTIPAEYGRFQRSCRALTGANRRRSGLGQAPAEAARLAASLPALGVDRRTLLELGKLVGGVAIGRTPRERLRTAPFLLHQSIFADLLAKTDPDLGVLFTNHVAAAMHRYWYATYPNDFTDDHYSSVWVRRHRDEIPAALVTLDRVLASVHRWCLANDRTLLVLSSMGQGPSPRVRSDIRHEAVITDPDRFLAELKVPAGVSILGSMVPQLTLDCGTAAVASATAARLADADLGQVFWDVDRSDSIVTVTYQIEVVDRETIRLGGAWRRARSVGIAVYEVDDHSSGRHTPRGILAVANSPSFKRPADGEVDYLDVAPAILAHLGVERADHHRLEAIQL